MKNNVLRKITIILVLSFVFTAVFSLFSLNVFAYPYTNATSSSSSTVYDCPNSSSMTIGSIGVESVKVYWQESGYYYIEYTVSGGGYSGYKRGYVPTGIINVSGIGSCSYQSWTSHTTSNQTVYDRTVTNSLVIGTVYSSDSITILDNDSGWYYIQYPITGGYKRGYVPNNTVYVTPSTGYVDYVNSGGVGGWVWQSQRPNYSIQAHVYIYNSSGVQLTAFALDANQYRSDLASLGYGNGYHGFSSSINWNALQAGLLTVNVYSVDGSGINPLIYQGTYNNIPVTKDYGTSEARGEVLVGDNLLIGFTVDTAATYIIETAQPNAPNGVVRDTMLGLYYRNGEYITGNDDINSSYTYYSRITANLNPGNYYVKVYEYYNKFTDIACYFSIYKQNSLIGTVGKNANYPYMSDYSNLTYDFKKLGNSTSAYNCLAYALGITNSWVWEWWGNPTLAQVDSYMSNHGFTKIPYMTSNCVVAYGTESSVGHFSKISNGITTAKAGSYELLEHSDYYAYYSQSTYGSPIAYYTK